MSVLKRRILVLISIFSVSVAIPAAATSVDVLMTNQPWQSSGGVCFGKNEDNVWTLGLKFTVGASDVLLSSVEAKFHDPGDDSVFVAGLHYDGDPAWGSELASLGEESGSGSQPELKFFPDNPVWLSSGSSYWVVVSVPGEDAECTGAWGAATAPTHGMLRFDTSWAIQSSGSFVEWGFPFKIQINGHPELYPVPTLSQWGLLLTILLLASAGAIVIRKYS